ncbi:hypothetical protein AAC387_Pa07g2379 [Persea americana]
MVAIISTTSQARANNGANTIVKHQAHKSRGQSERGTQRAQELALQYHHRDKERPDTPFPRKINGRQGVSVLKINGRESLSTFTYAAAYADGTSAYGSAAGSPSTTRFLSETPYRASSTSVYSSLGSPKILQCLSVQGANGGNSSVISRAMVKDRRSMCNLRNSIKDNLNGQSSTVSCESI